MKPTTCILILALITFKSVSAQEIKGYFGIVHPIVFFDKGVTKFNFKENYTIGFPFGINIPINKKIGYTIEVAPFIFSDSISTKVNSILIHPGLYYNVPNKFRIYTRLAFETTGRFGYTFILSKSFYSFNKSSVYTSIPIAIRYGNNKSNNASIGLLFGITF